MMNLSITTTKIVAALLEVQKNMEGVKKTSDNPYYKSKYAGLPDTIDAIVPLLNRNGIIVLQPTILLDSGISVVRTLLLHESGESVSSDTEILNARPNDPQAQGSAITYARRYGLQSIVCMKTEDDDGEAAMQRTPTKVSAPKTETPKAETPKAEAKKEESKVAQSTPASSAAGKWKRKAEVAAAPKSESKSTAEVAGELD